MMVQAFIDDSVDAGRILAMAGFVATPERWEKFYDEWTARCEHAGWPVFHMKDVWARGSDEALEHAKWHYYTIRDHVQGAIIMTVPIEPLKRVVEKTRLNAIGNPYFWGIKGIINLTAQYQAEWGGPIDFIFDERSEKRQVREGWEVYKATIPESIRAATGRDPIFEDDEKVLPLQAADMLASWCRKCWVEDGKLLPNKFPIPWGSFDEVPALIFQWSEKDIEDEFAWVLTDLANGKYSSFVKPD